MIERMRREHREIDELFGRFLAAAQAGDAREALEAIAAFDERLRGHTELEEERIYPAPTSDKLAEPEAEEEEARRFRQLLLEHVQVRELSGMIRRLLEERQDLEGARRLAPNLARRWDAHTAREESEVFGSAG